MERSKPRSKTKNSVTKKAKYIFGSFFLANSSDVAGEGLLTNVKTQSMMIATKVNQIAEQEGEGVLHRACRAGALEEVQLHLSQ